MSESTAMIIVILALIGLGVAIAGTAYSISRADHAVRDAREARKSADAAALAAERAARHRDQLCDLLYELDPHGRRARLARINEAPTAQLSRIHAGRQNGRGVQFEDVS